MSDWYVLDGHEPRRVGLMEGAVWFEKADRHVATDMVGEVKVSTVFLGLNHGWRPGEVHLFETMLFGNPEDPRDESTWRYATWDEAAAGHAAVVAALRDGTPLP